MRQIKFRGKSKRDGRWWFGNLCVKDTRGNTQIYDPENGGCFEIDPDTIGQFTGLHDINGREIYEGDIVTLGEDGLKCIIDYHEFLGMFYLKWIDDRPQSINDDKSSIGRMQKLYDIEVIGNVHDNPELLNEGE